MGQGTRDEQVWTSVNLPSGVKQTSKMNQSLRIYICASSIRRDSSLVVCDGFIKPDGLGPDNSIDQIQTTRFDCDGIVLGIGPDYQL
jgi:hypothetical protein